MGSRHSLASRAAHVRAGAGVDLDRFAFLDEERDVNGLAGFQLCRLGDVAGSIAAQTFRRFNDLQTYRRRQFYLNGLYQLPWNFTVAAAFWGREGYPIMPYVQVTGSDGRVRAVAVRHTNDLRYDDVYNLDLRIEKLIPITATANVTLSADFFNVVNSNTVLQYQNRLERGNSGDVKEIMSPRVLRWGARISF